MDVLEEMVRKRLEVVGGLHQPPEHSIRVDLEDAGHGADAEPFGESSDGPHQHLRRDALTLKRRAVGFLITRQL